ncbi:MAG: hypothetical protein A3E25_02570 [Burkholderiales bacterium RIFCSPHIGHO2_12_FULL_69_20]|nr:MAG: hypothetical protein A3E25_02570 [Burkholderiales bacterium RIFCSPHIGHO2_12_FULL_69_20]
MNRLARCLALLCLLCGAAAPAWAAGPEVVTIPLGFSNAYLIKAPRPVLVDAGGKHDGPALQAALQAEGVALSDLAAVIVTHGHSDHAGGVAAIQALGGKVVVLGQGDVPMAHAGRNGELVPVNLTARLLKLLPLDPRYTPFAPEVVVVAPLDLSRFGIAGQVLQMPGHTPGSLVVLLADGRAFVGDMMLGGCLGGALFPSRAGEQYFQFDQARNRSQIVELLRRPVHTFYLGHGGPVNRASVLSGFDLADPRQP